MEPLKEMTEEHGIELVKLARKAIKYFLATGKILKEEPSDKIFEKPMGVFVIIKKFDDKSLRGGAGLPNPENSLWISTIQAAINAALKDKRFSPLKSGDLDNIVIEVNVLSIPKTIEGKHDEYPANIDIGKHGLIIERKSRNSIMLPETALEWKWNTKEFLEEASRQAGLLKTAWKSRHTNVYSFEARKFLEMQPEGDIIESNIA